MGMLIRTLVLPHTKVESAHKVAWAAVKHRYQKSEDGKWHKKK